MAQIVFESRSRLSARRHTKGSGLATHLLQHPPFKSFIPLQSFTMASTNSSSGSEAEVVTSSPPTPATAASSVDVAPLNLDVKFVDSRWDEESDSWKHSDTTNPDIPAEQVQPMGAEATDSDSWEQYCFVVVRKHSKTSENSRRTITFEIVLKSPYLITACRNIMSDVRGVSWNSQPITVSTSVQPSCLCGRTLITFHCSWNPKRSSPTSHDSRRMRRPSQTAQTAPRKTTVC